MARVFFAGIAVLDFVFSVTEMPSEAVKYRATDAAIVAGGCAAGAAAAAARLGADAWLASRLGADVVGDLIVRDLDEDGVNTSLIWRSKDASSSYSSIFVDPRGERQIVNYRGKGLIENADWMDVPENTAAILADTRWDKAPGAAMKLARKLDIPGIVDVEAPLDDADLTQASHVAFARHGLSEFTGEEKISAGLKSAAKKLPGWLCVTDGAAGVYILQGGSVEHIPAFEVEVVDTLGAGDVWHGAFALGLAEGTNETDSILLANAAAALKCTKFGGRNGCPDRSTTEKFLKERS